MRCVSGAACAVRTKRKFRGGLRIPVVYRSRARRVLDGRCGCGSAMLGIIAGGRSEVAAGADRNPGALRRARAPAVVGALCEPALPALETARAVAPCEPLWVDCHARVDSQAPAMHSVRLSRLRAGGLRSEEPASALSGFQGRGDARGFAATAARAKAPLSQAASFSRGCNPARAARRTRRSRLKRLIFPRFRSDTRACVTPNAFAAST